MKAVWFVPGLALLALLVASLDEESGVARWRHLRAELAEADTRIVALAAEVAELRAEAERLERQRRPPSSAPSGRSWSSPDRGSRSSGCPLRRPQVIGILDENFVARDLLQR